MKDITFLGTSLDDIKAFPDEAKQEAGYQLHLLQAGDDPTDWKPVATVGKGVREIRISVKGQYRVFYIAKHCCPVNIIKIHGKSLYMCTPVILKTWET